MIKEYFQACKLIKKWHFTVLGLLEVIPKNSYRLSVDRNYNCSSRTIANKYSKGNIDYRKSL